MDSLKTIRKKSKKCVFVIFLAKKIERNNDQNVLHTSHRGRYVGGTPGAPSLGALCGDEEAASVGAVQAKERREALR